MSPIELFWTAKNSNCTGKITRGKHVNYFCVLQHCHKSNNGSGQGWEKVISAFNKQQALYKFQFLISTKLLVVTRLYGCIFQRVHTLINDHQSDLRQGPLKGLPFLLLTDKSLLSRTGMKSNLYLSFNYLPFKVGQIICTKQFCTN